MTSPDNRPTIVTICGSMRFYQQMLSVAEQRTAAGEIVIMPFCVVAPSEQDSDLKARLDVLHRHKIAMADRVVIVTNTDLYLGESTRAEISYAIELGKPIDWERR